MTLRHHAMLFPEGPGLAVVEALRRMWDPAMAAKIAAHITIVYPDEHPGLSTLRDRVLAVAAAESPFRLGLGELSAFPPPDEGCVYVDILDAEGRFAALREALTAPPFQPIAFPPHLTIIHPRTSALAPEFWRANTCQIARSGVIIDSIVITSTDGEGYAQEALVPFG